MSAEWPTQFVIDTSQDWVERVPRPSERDTHPAVLEQRQAIWDRADERNRKILKLTAKAEATRKAEIDAARDAQVAQAEARREKQRAEQEAILQRSFLASGGSLAQWEAEGPAILARHRQEATLRGDHAARAEHRQAMRGAF